jgi:aspartate ammonia-lyase
MGEVRVPAAALYGGQTTRALDNFQISRHRIHPEFYRAYGEVKKAAAWANVQVGKLDAERGDAIQRAADEVIAGKWADQFPLDALQAGAGTSYNMNVNEVIANRALELLGATRGDYSRLHPNDHVNKAQSTNDTMPTVMRITALRLLHRMLPALDGLAEAFAAKSAEFADIIKSGRTHLHDATQMTLGEEFGGYANNLKRAIKRIRATEDDLYEVPLGGTAVGTGLNAHPDYARLAVEKLAEITGLKLREAADRFQSMQSLGDFLALSAAMRGFAVELNKVTNDLRLLNSGPHTGLAEIELPPVQPGSSIMPGKYNPSMAEMANMACFHVVGHDAAIAFAAEAGQLELNVMMPYVAFALFDSLEVLANAARALDEKCVRGIRAHADRCREYAERSVGRAAALNEQLGYMDAAEVARKAIETGKNVDELTDQPPASG